MTAECYAACEAVARSHDENFPVASLLLPRAMRPHVAAVYAFARIADDIADEGAAPADERRARLTAWQRTLHEAARGGPPPAAGTRDSLVIAAGAGGVEPSQEPPNISLHLVCEVRLRR
jgi:phytoene/squalene synthetase